MFKEGDIVAVLKNTEINGIHGRTLIPKGSAGSVVKVDNDDGVVKIDVLGILSWFDFDEVEKVDSETQNILKQRSGVKYDSEKLQYQLIPPESLEKIAEVLTFGAKKYPQPDNWKRIDDIQGRYIGALMRHVEAYRSGEKIDPESKLPHLAHAGCCLMFMLWADDTQKSD